jgi:hypothetical protein
MDSDGRLWQRGLFQLSSSQSRTDGQSALLAVNVASQEGDLAYLSRQEIDSRLGELASKVDLWMADELASQSDSTSTGQLADVLVVAILGLLVTEQALAYWSSYHRRRTTSGDTT